jgi:4-phospho-D-threonate 3-dehydrogenase / 4-phospho-D-erythronate 3-dehydrogenase
MQPASSTDAFPLIGITMGDPAGIGPEIIVKALGEASVRSVCRPVVVGDARTMQGAVAVVGSALSVRRIGSPEQANGEHGVIEVVDLDNVDAVQLLPGRVSAMTGNAAYAAIARVIDLAMRGKVDATVTAPIHKEALQRAGHKFAGHTEIFAHLTGTRDYAMMLAEGDFRVIHVTTHVSLRQACDLVTRERVLTTIELAYNACRQLGIERPRIGVAGLNPHASDGGLFGSEEADHIAPAIASARARGWDVTGPLPADTLFPKAACGGFDIAIAMYHDQGHVPIKVKGFHFNPDTQTWAAVEGINVTLGLPIIRVSVDHGTACDQAGKGTASPNSLITAIQYATRMALTRRRAV